MQYKWAEAFERYFTAPGNVALTGSGW